MGLTGWCQGGTAGTHSSCDLTGRQVCPQVSSWSQPLGGHCAVSSYWTLPFLCGHSLHFDSCAFPSDFLESWAHGIAWCVETSLLRNLGKWVFSFSFSMFVALLSNHLMDYIDTKSEVVSFPLCFHFSLWLVNVRLSLTSRPIAWL